MDSRGCPVIPFKWHANSWSIIKVELNQLQNTVAVNKFRLEWRHSNKKIGNYLCKNRNRNQLAKQRRVNSFQFLWLTLRKVCLAPSSTNCNTYARSFSLLKMHFLFMFRTSNTFGWFMFSTLRINQREILCHSISDSDIISLGRLNTKISHFICFIPFLLFLFSFVYFFHAPKSVTEFYTIIPPRTLAWDWKRCKVKLKCFTMFRSLASKKRWDLHVNF